MSTRRRGMDHDLYPYSSIRSRPTLTWPGKAAVAATVVLYFEYWELDPPQDSLQDPGQRDPIADLFPSYRFYSWREYGNRVGIFRILDLLDRLRLPVTVAANTAACQRYPFLVDEFLRRDYEIAAHGTHATRMINSAMSEAAETNLINEAINTLQRLTGRRPVGWIGQDFGESTRTPYLLAEAGLQYLMDWPNDDQPYLMTVGDRLVSIPIQTEWDEVHALWTRRVPSTRFPDIVHEALSVLRDEGRQSGRYFGLHIHPWLSGKPHRFPYLERALERLVEIEDVWWTTASGVSDAFVDASRQDLPAE